jgi:hypothetical protein
MNSNAISRVVVGGGGRDGSPQPSGAWGVDEKAHGKTQRLPMRLPSSKHARGPLGETVPACQFLYKLKCHGSILGKYFRQGLLVPA